jgi:prevent-host-death family protein
MQIDLREAKNRLSQLIEAVKAGEEVIIADHGEPVVRLVPAGAATAVRPIVGDADPILDWLTAHPVPACARRSAEEIDAAIEEERRSWG